MTEETQNNSQNTAENVSTDSAQSNNAENAPASTTQPTNTENASTSTAPANNAESASAPATPMKTYYWSTDDVPFRVIASNDELTANQYPLVVAAPDPSIKSPKYDWMKRQWYDISEQSYGQRLTEAVEGLKKLEGSINILQEAHKDTMQSAEDNDKAMDQLQATVQQTNQMVANLSAMIATFNNENSQSNTNNGTEK